jgi:SARP family transcriptional regulator, regulator of embCAB operon
LRRLCPSGAQQLRVAAELETAANTHRLVAQEMRQGIDAVLASWERQIKAAQARALASSAQPRADRRAGQKRRLRRILRHTAAVPEKQDGRTSYVSAKQEAPQQAYAMGPFPPMPPSAVGEAEVVAQILGPLDLTVAGQRILRWNSLKARTVFEYLVIHFGRPVRRDVLMELMWPDHTHSSARNNLNAALYSLRNTLSQRADKVQYILYRDGCYLPNPELRWSIDRTEFLETLEQASLARRGGHSQRAIDSYQRAVRLYRGPLFEDDSDGDWYLSERRHLKELYLQALERLAEMYLEIRDLPTATQVAQLALNADQCCEPVHRLLMRCYALQHQQQLVSRQYQLCAAALHDELGVAPGADTVGLFHSLTSAT